MYSVLPTFVLGFHGCDKKVGEKILSGEDFLQPSNNSYDWLGNGIYFWENNPVRAFEYAKKLKENPKRCKSKIEEEFVLGAIIDLGYCLNLLESKSLNIIKQGYELLYKAHQKTGSHLPRNKPIGKERDLLLRHLDCAVIEIIHTYNKLQNKKEYDSVRGVFFEGKPLYRNAGFMEKNHIQICVKNPNCIKGYFRTLDVIETHPIP